METIRIFWFIVLLAFLSNNAFSGSDKVLRADGNANLLLQSGGKNTRISISPSGDINLPGFSTDEVTYINASGNLTTDPGLSFDGTTFIFPLSDGKIVIGDGTNSSSAVTVSGDITLSNVGVAAIEPAVVVDADVNSGANITATKLGTGVVDNTEFNLLDGLLGDILTTTNTKVITNKDYDGGTASNTSRLTIPKDTKANLDGLTRKQGTLVYASDEDVLYRDDGTTLTQVGGGGDGGLTTVTKTSSATLATSGEEIVICDPTSGDVTLTLPASSNTLVYRFHKKTASPNKCIIDGNASETIDGQLTQELFDQFTSFQIAGDGSNWFSIKNKTRSVCYVLGQKPSGTNGGDRSANTAITRELNTLIGDCDFVSLDSNQVTLGAGSYCFEGRSALQSSLNIGAMGWVWNVTDGTIAADGTSHQVGSEGYANTPSFGCKTITAPKVFELRQWASFANVTTGLGIAKAGGANNQNTVETYSVLKITRAR